MELQLVSFEQAKSLKELGFPQEVYPWHLYDIHTGILYKDYDDSSPVYLTENDTCMAPTLELAAKWLRKEKKIYIDITWGNMQGNIIWCASLNNLGKGSSMLGDIKHVDSYEEALSAGIDKAIEILNKRNLIMELQLVSFEQAKALKELGFPQLKECAWYSTYLGQISIINYDMKYPEICAPTLELVAKWLREEKRCYISPIPACYDQQHEFFNAWRITIQLEDNFDEYEEWLETYEDALSSGIDKAIETLKMNNCN